MSAGTQSYYTSFDAVFLNLPPAVRARIEAKILEIGSQLGSFQHHRLKGSNRFRARVGDYRIIYTFDLEQNKIHLLAIGHRREIYRSIQLASQQPKGIGKFVSLSTIHHQPSIISHYDA